MDLLEYLLRDHRELRRLLDSAVKALNGPRGTGWDDRLLVKGETLTELLRDFTGVLDRHEKIEDRYLDRLLREVDAGGSSARALREGHELVEGMLRLCSAVAYCCDNGHVYSFRRALTHLKDAVESHMEHEEREFFPLLKQGIPAPVLEELGRRAEAGGLEQADFARLAAASRTAAAAIKSSTAVKSSVRRRKHR